MGGHRSSKGQAVQLVSCRWWGWSDACHSEGNKRQRGQESELCLPFLEWMTQQLSYLPWRRVGDQDSRVALLLAGVWIHILAALWGWCGLGTRRGCGMALAKEGGHQFFVVVFAHFGLVWFPHKKHMILILSTLSCILAFLLHV